MLPSRHTLFAVDRDAFDAMSAVAGRLPMPTAAQIREEAQAQAQTLQQVKGQIAVLPVYGMIEQHPSAWSYWYGGASTDLIGETLQQLVDSRDVEAIVLDFHTPGGVSYGVQELSDLIFSLRGRKPIIGIANSMAASAGYWLISACDQVVVTPGGEVGSVGVYIMHVDYSKALEKDGIDVEFVKAGKYKVVANSYAPLDADGRDYLQEIVDECYAAFTSAVARNRGVEVEKVLANFGQGKCLTAQPARQAGMVDRVASLNQVLAKLIGAGPTAGKAAAAASAEVLRLRHEHRKAHYETTIFRAK